MLHPDHVYTLKDLESWPNDKISLAVIGCPVAHSKSPRMHNAALKALAQKNNIFANWTYYKFDLEPEKLKEAFPLFHAKGFYGMNLTVPHKVHAVPLVSISDPTAKLVGAVNTLRKTSNGYEGFNTDGYGLSRALQSEFKGGGDSVVKGKTVILLGAGGAARGAAIQMLQDGCDALWIGNRNQERLNGLLDVLKPWKDKVHGFNIEKNPNALPRERCIVINATTLGMRSDDEVPLDLTGFDRDCLVYDMVYSPPKTRLLQSAEAKGMSAANGLSMLVWQGAKALQIWIDSYMEESERCIDDIGSKMKEAIKDV
jgi:shikimate dehydrogenase